MKARCAVCFRHCMLEEGETGFCGARRNVGGRVIASNYGRLTALALDPIEKKPLARFMPGSMILSVGSYGCSLDCPFCQNYEIASAREISIRISKGDKRGEESRGRETELVYQDGGRSRRLETAYYTPQDLCALAEDLAGRGNIGIAFTYNEPLVGWEFVRDTAELFHSRGMKTVLVTNGMASREVLDQILPFIDAMNIDLKGFTEGFYRDFLKGDLAMVKEFIAAAAEGCHVELTKLIIPGRNDSEEEMRRMTAWIASLRGGRGREIPLHVSRYFPRHKYRAPATPVETVCRLAEVAAETLSYVYTGNV